MKKLLIIFIVILSTKTYSQYSTNFEKGFKVGYCKGYKEINGEYSTCPVAPVPPVPEVGKESYNDGVIAGYNAFRKNKNKKDDLKNSLISGAALVGKSKIPKPLNNYIDINTEEKVAIPLGEPKVKIIKKLEVNLKDYKKIAIVEAPYKRRSWYKFIEKVLISSQFEIINPANRKNKVFKKKFKKNPLFLRNEKNENWLYLYINRSSKIIKGFKYNTSFVTLRDFNNEIIYKSEEVNRTSIEMLDFLISY